MIRFRGLITTSLNLRAFKFFPPLQTLGPDYPTGQASDSTSHLVLVPNFCAWFILLVVRIVNLTYLSSECGKGPDPFRFWNRALDPGCFPSKFHLSPLSVLSAGFDMTLESNLNDLIGFGRRIHLRGHGL